MMKKMTTDCRYVFMGTPAFAVRVLEHLVETIGKPLLVVTQTDKPVGRKVVMTPSAVKQYAADAAIPVRTPARLSDDETYREMAALKPDLIITAAYGKILPLSVLALPAFGCLNVHASLLPKYRGASPVSAAILAGDQKTGITIMQMDQGLDTGPILSQSEMHINPADTTGTLMERLSEAAGPLLTETVRARLAGAIRERAQDGALASFTRPLVRADGILDFSRPAVSLERRVRAMQPWPRAYCRLHGQDIKVEAAAVAADGGTRALPGTIIGLEGGIDVACGEGTLRLLDIVPSGRKKMHAAALAHNLTLGDRFDNILASSAGR